MLCYTMLHCVTLHYVTCYDALPHDVILCYATPRCVTQRYVTPVMSRYIMSHDVMLH